MYLFTNDYGEGCLPEILRALEETNYDQTPGYGTDRYCDRARALIRGFCGAEDADVHFLVGGTQANLTVISAFLRPWQGVVSADSGHINVHETGAIEATGHKVLAIPSPDGKVSPKALREVLDAHFSDPHSEHTVQPGMLYISFPTENGQLYSLAELTELSAVCRERGIPLYLDGARLSYGLTSPACDLTAHDIARLCDVFYIGGTKCGALFGEAVVIPDPKLLPHFFTIVKQHGALLAKGRLLGLQFDTLFTDGLYQRIGRTAIELADRIREGLRKGGVPQAFDAPTNQIFIRLEDEKLKRLSGQAELSFWEKADGEHTVLRAATSWATQPEQAEALIACLTEA